MKLAIIRPGKTGEDELTVMSKVIPGKRVLGADVDGSDMYNLIRKAEKEAYLNRHRFTEFAEDVYIWKMPQFDLEDPKVDEFMDRASKFKGLIMDLRGNGGGLVSMLNRLVGNFFEKDVKIADWKGRKEFEPQIAKARKSKFFPGKLVVLIDSESGSAAEIFARVVQLEGRGTVIGDVSSGKVMVSRVYPKEIGTDTVVPFAINITEADLIMTDGKSIEHVGVVPDTIMLPTAADLAAERDPVLAYALEQFGVRVTPSDAGKLFPREWRK